MREEYKKTSTVVKTDNISREFSSLNMLGEP
jgi:hypothetical protein